MQCFLFPRCSLTGALPLFCLRGRSLGLLEHERREALVERGMLPPVGGRISAFTGVSREVINLGGTQIITNTQGRNEYALAARKGDGARGPKGRGSKRLETGSGGGGPKAARAAPSLWRAFREQPKLANRVLER